MGQYKGPEARGSKKSLVDGEYEKEGERGHKIREKAGSELYRALKAMSWIWNTFKEEKYAIHFITENCILTVMWRMELGL